MQKNKDETVWGIFGLLIATNSIWMINISHKEDGMKQCSCLFFALKAAHQKSAGYIFTMFNNTNRQRYAFVV